MVRQKRRRQVVVLAFFFFLLLPHAEPNPAVQSAAVWGGKEWGGGVALGEAIWVSHLQRSYGCDSFGSGSL